MTHGGEHAAERSLVGRREDVDLYARTYSTVLRSSGVYVLGKAATLNGDIGDVLISLSFEGVDSTYASAVAILRRILR